MAMLEAAKQVRLDEDNEHLVKRYVNSVLGL